MQKIKVTYLVDGTPVTRRYEAVESVVHVVGPASERGSSIELTLADGSRFEILARQIELVERTVPKEEK